ncbi:MAG: nucleotidyltransferase family protein [Methylococcales bacterium]|nr:nucleotidyltransferase family protein [Methylococcales bacterium]
MKDIEKIKLTIDSTIKDALTIIDSGAVKIALVVDKDNKLLGTLTDGDVRRGILKGIALSDTIVNIYFKTPTVVSVNASKEEIIKICTSKKIHQIPVVDEKGIVVSVSLLDELLKPEVHPNKVVLMVGGLGSRLRPLTENTPKPMLHVGNKPILQTIIEKFASYGFVNIIMCVNYKSHVIQQHFGDGSQFGVNIEYISEHKKMGTAGALGLLTEKPKESFFVMNGDLLTNINFESLLDFHESHNAVASMCVREYDFQVPYGVVHIDNGKIKSVEEKPVHKFFVSAGIYMLTPDCIKLIPSDEFYDMPMLFDKLIEMDENTISFPIREYWLDIGRIDEYEKANLEYHKVF